MTIFPAIVITPEDLRALDRAVAELELAWRAKASVRRRQEHLRNEARRLKAQSTWYGKEAQQ